VIYADVPMADYVADRAEISGDIARPASLNSGLAHVLLTRSPAHARIGHPRLHPAWAPDDNPAYDLGSAAHAVLLEGRELFVIDYPDYRSKHAQALRDEAKAAGRLPVLAHQASDIASMVVTASTALANCPDLGYAIADYLPERTIIWEQDGAWLRCRPDWLSRDFRVICSYKTTRAIAEPNAFLRTILTQGYFLQAAWELAGVKAATGVDAAYVWLVGEVDEPFAVSLLGMSPAFLAFAQSAMRKAVSVWAACLERDHWPAYSERIAYLDHPAWAEANFMERHGYAPPSLDEDDRPIEEVLFEKEHNPR
jgi:hypothetical protein